MGFESDLRAGPPREDVGDHADPIDRRQCVAGSDENARGLDAVPNQHVAHRARPALGELLVGGGCAAVVGVPHKTLGEEVKAVVQLRAGASAREDELRDFCRVHLADFKVPEYVEIRDEPLPRNPAGKVLKSLLRGGDTSFAAADDQAL